MYCIFCGKQIEDDAAFCSCCGKPVDMMTELVAAARTGDQDAVSALYEKTYSKVYYTVKSMIRDEDAVFDIVQDTYIKAFTHLDSFQGGTKFLPWVRQIAANTARDWLKRKRPMLFAELAPGDGQETPVEEMFPDERSENLPEQVVDQQETSRLIREIIEELPEDQRAAIGMFYYEEMSVKEIAAAMGASESAVKSRLMYGRSKIEKKVRELEKQGTKLYGLSPILFLLLLFRSQNAYAAEVPDSRILHAILASQRMDAAGAAGAVKGVGKAGTAAGAVKGAGKAGTAAGAEAAGAGTGAAVAGSLGVLKISLIAFAVVAVTELGIFGAAWIASHSAESQEAPAIEETAMEEVISRKESETPEEPETSEELNVPEGSEALEEPDPIDAALEQYRIIVGQADSYEYEGSYGFEDVSYRYALVQMRPDDPVPTLLLEMQERDWTFASYVRVFQYDPDTETLRQPAKTIPGSGIRCSLAMAWDGYGIMSTEWSGGTGATTVSRITLDGDSFKWEEYWRGRFDQMSDLRSFLEIEWHEIGDLTALESWTAPYEPADRDVLPTDGDRIVLTGTVGTYDYEGIIALQGLPDPYGYDENTVKWSQSRTYHVILLDMPQIINLYQIGEEDGGYSDRVALMISIDYADGMDQYEGQHITFSIDPANTYWPSEAGLPYGQPIATDIHVLE